MLEADSSNGVLTISVCAGFAAADVRDVGPSVTVTVDRYYGLDVGLHKTYLKNIRKATRDGGTLGLAALQGENRIMDQVVAAFKKTEENAFIANATTAKTIAEDFINYIWTTRGKRERVYVCV